MISKRNLNLAVATILSIVFVGCGGGGGSSSTPATNNTTSFSGVAVHGYISGAIACLDTNVNGKCDSGEPTAKTLADGTFSFNKVKITNTSLLPVIVSGGTDTATGKAFTGELKNIVNTASIQAGDSLIVSPLTDLSATLYLQSNTKNAETFSNAKKSVATVYGLTREEVVSNPMKNPKVFAKVMEVQQTKTLIKAILPQSSNLTQDQIGYVVKKAIAKQLGTKKNVKTTEIIKEVESVLNVTVPENKKTFVVAQAQVLQTTFDELAAKQTLNDDALNNFQVGIENIQGEAVARITNATEKTTITVVSVESADDIIAHDNLTFPPSVPTL